LEGTADVKKIPSAMHHRMDLQVWTEEEGKRSEGMGDLPSAEKGTMVAKKRIVI